MIKLLYENKGVIKMRNIKCSVHYPWAGIQNDEEVIEIEDDATNDEIEAIVEEVVQDIIWNRISIAWEEV
jgi:hypothetical protein